MLDIKPYLPEGNPRPRSARPVSTRAPIAQEMRMPAVPRRGTVVPSQAHYLDVEHTSNIPVDVAPEYRRRNGRPTPGYVRPIPSGIHDLIDEEVIRRSGPEDIVTQPQHVSPGSIMAGQDCRTTVMVRNIPNKLDAQDLKRWLDVTSRGLYDFSYLRVDFSNNCNVGYAFVNFTKPEYIVGFVEERVGKPWRMYGSEKTCEISYATVQGSECLIAKFRNSSVMQEWVGFRPRVFYSVDSPDIPEGMQPGDEHEFPKPDNPMKLQRSLDNAQAIGLYPPRSNFGNRGRDHHSGGRGQWDRGTPRAIFEEQNFNSFRPGPTVVFVSDPRLAQRYNMQANRRFGSRPQPFSSPSFDQYSAGPAYDDYAPVQYFPPDDSFYQYPGNGSGGRPRRNGGGRRARRHPDNREY